MSTMSGPGDTPPSQYPNPPPQQPRPVLPVADDVSLPPMATPVSSALPPQPRGYYPPPMAAIAQPVPAIPLPPPDFGGSYPPPNSPQVSRPGVVTALGVGAVAGGCIGILMAVAIAIAAFAFVAAAD